MREQVRQGLGLGLGLMVDACAGATRDRSEARGGEAALTSNPTRPHPTRDPTPHDTPPYLTPARRPGM